MRDWSRAVESRPLPRPTVHIVSQLVRTGNLFMGGLVAEWPCAQRCVRSTKSASTTPQSSDTRKPTWYSESMLAPMTVRTLTPAPMTMSMDWLTAPMTENNQSVMITE